MLEVLKEVTGEDLVVQHSPPKVIFFTLTPPTNIPFFGSGFNPASCNRDSTLPSQESASTVWN